MRGQSLNSRRLFDACIMIAQIDFRKRGPDALKRVKEEGLMPVFETRITDLARLAGIPGKNYTRIYDELDQLFEMVLRWNIIGESAQVEWEMKSHFLSSLGYGKDKKRGLIRFSLHPSVLEIVLEPSNWATLSLQAMEGLGTSASYALFQNTWRYVNTHAKITAAFPTATWIELLLGHSSYVEDDPEEGKRVVRYADFKRRVLLDAIRRVNNNPALSYTLELKEHKSGTRVSKLQFKFIPKQTHSLGIPLTWPEDVVLVLEGIGYSSKEIEDMSQSRSYEEVAESIVRLKDAEARLRMQGKKISSKKAYFSGILSNVAAGASLDELDDAKLEQEAQAQAAQQRAQELQERMRAAFDEHSYAAFAHALFEMSSEERSALLNRFETSKEGLAAAVFVAKGWSPKNRPALSVLKKWIKDRCGNLLETMLPNPHDRDYEAWMAWRLDQASGD
jgi:plasmid replication initiation protein